MRKLLIVTGALVLLAVPAAAQEYLWCYNADEVRVEVDGSTVTVIHEAAVYNCCPDPFAYDVVWEEDHLVVTETEVLTNPCYCICCFDLYTTVENVPPGAWVMWFRWYDYEIYDWLQVEVPFTVDDLGQGGPVFVGATDDSGCLTSSAVDDIPPVTTSWGRVKAIYE